MPSFLDRGRVEYYTPDWACREIAQVLPRDLEYWEGFRGNGQSTVYWQQAGLNIQSFEEDFFENNHGDALLTNPPFNVKRRLYKRLMELNKPFCLLLPTASMSSKSFRRMAAHFNDEIQIAIPSKRIHFDRADGLVSNSTFDCCFFCYRLLPKPLVFLPPVQ